MSYNDSPADPTYPRLQRVLAAYPPFPRTEPCLLCSGSGKEFRRPPGVCRCCKGVGRVLVERIELRAAA